MTRAEQAAAQRYGLREVTPENIKLRSEFIQGYELAEQANTLGSNDTIDFLVERGYTILTPTESKSLDELIKRLKEIYGSFDSLTRCDAVEIINYAYAQGRQDLALTWEDIKTIVDIYDDCLNITFEKDKPAYESEAFYKEVLDRFLKSKEK